MGRLSLSGTSGITVTAMDFTRLGLGERFCDFEQTWRLQRQIHSEVAAGTRPNTVLLLEHDDVITAGRRTNLTDRPPNGVRVVDVDRGGKLTWHGPGQLVVYPIVRLTQPVDVVAYVRALETAIIEVANSQDIPATRIAGASGVWVPGTPNRKLAAIGVRVAKGVTMHGLALNVHPDLQNFSSFVPCGIPDAAVTSIVAEGGTIATPLLIADLVTEQLRAALAPLLPDFRSRQNSISEHPS